MIHFSCNFIFIMPALKDNCTSFQTGFIIKKRKVIQNVKMKHGSIGSHFNDKKEI